MLSQSNIELYNKQHVKSLRYNLYFLQDPTNAAVMLANIKESLKMNSQNYFVCSAGNTDEYLKRLEEYDIDE